MILIIISFFKMVKKGKQRKKLFLIVKITTNYSLSSEIQHQPNIITINFVVWFPVSMYFSSWLAFKLNKTCSLNRETDLTCIIPEVTSHHDALNISHFIHVYEWKHCKWWNRVLLRIRNFLPGEMELNW